MYNLLTIIISYYYIYYINIIKYFYFKYKILLIQFDLPSALLLVGVGVLQRTYTTSPTPPPSLVTGSDGDAYGEKVHDPSARPYGRGMGACYRYVPRTQQAPDRPLLGGAARDYVGTVCPSGTAAWWHNKKKYVYNI